MNNAIALYLCCGIAYCLVDVYDLWKNRNNPELKKTIDDFVRELTKFPQQFHFIVALIVSVAFVLVLFIIVFAWPVIIIGSYFNWGRLK